MWRWQGAQELVGWGMWKRGHGEIVSGEGVFRGSWERVVEAGVGSEA